MDDTSEKPSGPEPQTTSTRGGGGLWLLAGFVLLLVIYPLSIGPAARIHQKYPAAAPAIEAIYTPVTVLADHSPRLQIFVLWYITNVWGLAPQVPTAPTVPTNSVPASGK
jgi:hypothetical protein